MNGQSQTVTLQVHVPMMTNESVIRKGEQLVMEHTPEKMAKKRKTSDWKTEVAAAAKGKAKPPARPPSSTVIPDEV